jgi:hypothetical protein
VQVVADATPAQATALEVVLGDGRIEPGACQQRRGKTGLADLLKDVTA